MVFTTLNSPFLWSLTLTFEPLYLHDSRLNRVLSNLSYQKKPPHGTLYNKSPLSP